MLRRLRDPFPDGYAPRFARRRPRAAAATDAPATAGPDVSAGTTSVTSGPTSTAAGRPAGRPDRRQGEDRGPGARGGLDAEAALDLDLDLDPVLAREVALELDPTVTPDSGRPLRGPEPGPLRAVKRKLGKALVPGERILVAQTRHPVVLAEPVLTSVLALLGIAAVSPYLGAADLLRNVLMVGWLVLAGRAMWAWLQWAHDYFVVTDRRLIRLHGLFDVQRDMMPLTKVTDMAYERPFWGRPFNYGRFVLESAGQDQALRVISYVRDPDDVDALIGRQIFARPPFVPPGRDR